MTKYIVRRLIQMLPLLIGISIIIFLIIQAAPGGPETLFYDRATFVDPAVVQAYIERLGLDKPVYVQYWNWLKAIAQGDMGVSFTTGRQVASIIFERVPATLQLMATAFILAAILAIPIGIFSAVKQYSIFDITVTGLSYVGIAMPVFWFALILQLVFSVHLKWLPTSGRVTVGQEGLLDSVRHMILPAFVLSLRYIASWSRYTRTSLLNVINSDYIRTARSKGNSELRILIRHALKNSLIPVVSIMALDLAGLFSGAVITETVFAWPGIGRLFVQSMGLRDYPVLMGILVLGSCVVILFNLVADIVYGFLDPRISYS